MTQLRSGELTRNDGYIVITMCYYPRGLRRDLRDEYRKSLAPNPKLFKDWQRLKRRGDHESAFKDSNYQERFQLSEEGLKDLERLTHLSVKEDVYLVCQCELGERCHRELLMLMAKDKFNARIAPVLNEY